MASFGLALVEISNFSPTILASDRCAKAAGIEILGIEKTNGEPCLLKMTGPIAALREATEVAMEAARNMGAKAFCSMLPAPLDETKQLASGPPEYMALLSCSDTLAPREEHMNNSDALGLLETQGLVAALHATDEMLKSANVALVGKEKIGSAYVTIMIRGDVAAVEAAIGTGKRVVERLGGKLIMADIIARPHRDLAALLPK